jgi:amino acid transporter
MSVFKRLVVGQPIATSEEQHQRLGRPTALAVFASDAISSTAYATEEILLVLVPVAGLAALTQLIPLAIIVMVLLVLVITSYRQTIYAYPSGGGSYVVSRENLGEKYALVAGASLLVDYILTVAVSVSAGVAAITSAFPSLLGQKVVLCLLFVAVMTLANLRGLKESGRLFAGPTYIYIFSIVALIVVGLVRYYSGDLKPLAPNTEALNELTKDGELLTGVTVLLFLRAFSSGAVALTGIEAISNGVPAFKKPESHNAATTLMVMGGILGGFFFGLSLLANLIKPTVTEDETVLSIMGRAVLGDGTVMYYILQFATFSILILAANTAFADFPRVSSIIAGDGYLPRQLSNRGDRLVFSNGVLALAAVAAGLIVLFGGDTSKLIPLYAVGVFCGFTLSQVGMVVHHRRIKEPGWKVSQVINTVGALATFIVLLVVVYSKFSKGAWVPVVLIPLIVFGFRRVRHHYDKVTASLAALPTDRVTRHAHTVVVLIGSVNRGVLSAVAYARSMRPDRLVAISVVNSPEEEQQIVDAWEAFELPVELRTVFSPFRDLTQPILDVIDELDAERPDDVVTVVIPEFVVEHWWDAVLHNQSAVMLRTKLRQRPNTAITLIPVQVGHERPAGDEKKKLETQ